MSINSPTYYAQQFATDVQMLTQQIESKFQRAVTVGTGHYGEQASPVDQVGKLEASENTSRFEPMPRTDYDTDRRWVLPRFWDISPLKDKNDLIKQITDERQALARSAVAGMNRRKDLSIIDGMLNANLTGKSATTSTSMTAGNVVSVNTGGAASRFNVAKLRNALQILLANEVDKDSEMLFVAVDSKANDGMLAETQVTNADYNQQRDGVPVLQNGLISSFLGFNFIHSERLLSFNGTDDAAGTSTPCPFWAQSGVYLGIWDDTNTRIDERTDLRGIPWQLYCRAAFGGTRLEEAKVGKIWSRP